MRCHAGGYAAAVTFRAFASLLVLSAAALCVPGCGSPRCDDVDLDGYGPGCAAGADCDPRNPTRNVDCVNVPPPDCSATPTAPGCPCFAGSVAPCYTGAESTLDVGICRGGTTLCLADFYGACVGATLPGSETCNGIDDDCDGRLDEFVLSPCGGCDPSCTGVVWGPGGVPFTDEPGIALTTEGAIELERVAPDFGGVWLLNSADDTVSHIEASNATEVARHESGGDDPSRVAVDYRGDVFVTNRAFGGQGKLTKIAGSLAHCVDRDTSNSIETSSGPNDVPALPDDECVLFSVPVGGIDAVPRALAIDGSFESGGGGGGDPWVGLHGAEAVVHLDGETGAVIETVPLPGFAPYAAAFDGRGRLWLASEQGEFARIDPGESPPSVERTLLNLGCYLVYGIATTSDDALVGTGFGCDHVFRYEPRTAAVSRLATLPSTRSVVVDGQTAYVAHTDGRLSILGVDPLEVRGTVDSWAMGLSPIESIGVAADSVGTVWLFSAQGASGDRGVATRIDPITRTVLAQLPVGRGPHTQGDSTGRSLRGSYAPMGTVSAAIPGCGDAGVTRYRNLHVDLEPGVRSSVTVAMRFGEDASALASAAFTDLGTFPGSANPLPLTSVPDGWLLELRLVLTSDSRESSPLVRQVGVEYGCTLE